MPTPNRNLTKNHPVDQIIRSKEKVVMTIIIVNEELCLIYEGEPKSMD